MRCRTRKSIGDDSDLPPGHLGEGDGPREFKRAAAQASINQQGRATTVLRPALPVPKLRRPGTFPWGQRPGMLGDAGMVSEPREKLGMNIEQAGIPAISGGRKSVQI